MLSYEQERFVIAGQYILNAKGNQKGKDESEHKGCAIFGEVKINKKAAVIVRYDSFDPDKDKDNDENTRTILGCAWRLHKDNIILIDQDSLDYKDATKNDEKRTQVTMQVKF